MIRNFVLRVPKFFSNSYKSSRFFTSASDGGAPTIFDKIINKQIPAKIVYEDEEVITKFCAYS